MPFYPGTPDSINERQAEINSNYAYLAQETSAARIGLDNPRQNDYNSRSSRSSIGNFMAQQAIGSTVQSGIRAVVGAIRGGASAEAGGASVEAAAGAAATIVEDIAEIGAVFL